MQHTIARVSRGFHPPLTLRAAAGSRRDQPLSLQRSRSKRPATDRADPASLAMAIVWLL